MSNNSNQKNLHYSTCCQTGHLKLQESYSWIFNHGATTAVENVIFIIHKVVNIQKETD